MDAKEKNPEAYKAALYWLAAAHQQNFYEISSDWNRYECDEHAYLKNYIGYALFGPPSFDNSQTECAEIENCKEYTYEQKNAKSTIEAIYQKIVEHGTQNTNEREILCSIVYVCFYDEKLASKCDNSNLESLIISKPIFKINKYAGANDNEVWFIDDMPRVYKGWNDFLLNNNLPACMMIVPKDGLYQADMKEVWSDISSPVWLEIMRNKSYNNVTRHLDTASTIANIGCVGIGVFSLFTPLAPAVIAASVFGAVTTGAWGLGRSTQELIDRKKHDQSINVTNRAAFSAWLGVVGGTVGLGANGSSALLTRAIRSGTTIAEGAKLAHDAVMVSNIVINGMGIGIQSLNVYSQYKEDGSVSKKDIFFLSAHILFVCNSVVNAKLANDIIKTNQNQILKDYEASLRSNRHRKEFMRLVRNTAEILPDEVSKNAQIIRSIRQINNKDEFFAYMVRNRKVLKENGAKASFFDDHVQINGERIIPASEFVNQDSTILPSTSLASQPVPSPVVQNSITSPGLMKKLLSVLNNFIVQKCVRGGYFNSQNSNFSPVLKDIECLSDSVAENIFKHILEIAYDIGTKVLISNYSAIDALSDATRFVWMIVKKEMSKKYPAMHKITIMFEKELENVLKDTMKNVRSNINEWVNAFQTYLQNRQESMNVDEVDYPNSPINELSEHLNLIDLKIFMELPDICIEEQIQSVLQMSNQSNTAVSKKIIEVGVEELQDFFSKHGIKITVPLKKRVKEFKTILFDLENVQSIRIIFYKVLVIAANFSKKIREEQESIEHYLTNTTKFVWILMKLNYEYSFGDVKSNDGSGYIQTLIALYKYENINSSDMINAFRKYETLRIS